MNQGGGIMTHKYKLKYQLNIEHDPDGFCADEITENEGLTDGLVVFSILHLEDGSYSQQIVIAADANKLLTLIRDQQSDELKVIE